MNKPPGADWEEAWPRGIEADVSDETENHPPATGWRRSSRCDTNTCLEIARSGQLIWLRNSERPEDAVSCTEPEWSAFRAGLLAGDFEDASPVAAAHPRPAPRAPAPRRATGQTPGSSTSGRASRATGRSGSRPA